MRRVLLAALFVASSVGMFTIPAVADNSGNGNVVLSFDFSDNSAPASLSNGPFNVIADVLPEHTGGVVRMIAIAPDNAGVSNLVCSFQPVQQSQVECAFNFTSNGVWTVKAQYAPDVRSDVVSVSITRLRVAN
ncbi:MAG TPA: hypothetical protein VNF08_05580 [Acidimicrobiales bacterium]|nr:hypothetical protein [Acidimicrobiales bacterium]